MKIIRGILKWAIGKVIFFGILVFVLIRLFAKPNAPELMLVASGKGTSKPSSTAVGVDVVEKKWAEPSEKKNAAEEEMPEEMPGNGNIAKIDLEYAGKLYIIINRTSFFSYEKMSDK